MFSHSVVGLWILLKGRDFNSTRQWVILFLTQCHRIKKLFCANTVDWTWMTVSALIPIILANCILSYSWLSMHHYCRSSSSSYLAHTTVTNISSFLCSSSSSSSTVIVVVFCLIVLLVVVCVVNGFIKKWIRCFWPELFLVQLNL